MNENEKVEQRKRWKVKNQTITHFLEDGTIERGNWTSR